MRLLALVGGGEDPLSRRQPLSFHERRTGGSGGFVYDSTYPPTGTHERVSTVLGVLCGCVYVRDDYAV